ncbi:hypothetical protein LEP1GSC060_3854 [Leptospira weilii serovar Ranarum str. ICFT]|uniref:Uncharacterized protein n=1 Tax=Leptospira weilii serovar Ranarum str. ICFT TaxID=1218598 RepID=N1WRR9_9LEPT|nr:hypothetical protein LEP1GSC060_3854 [Leptospira weilii serovar Ranarum str. ICFT]
MKENTNLKNRHSGKTWREVIKIGQYAIKSFKTDLAIFELLARVPRFIQIPKRCTLQNFAAAKIQPFG